jgi:ubiquinone/menaquinone biosynthesis C-methylase UbiE
MSSKPVQAFRCTSPEEHYRLDGELFDYTAPPDPFTTAFWERLRAVAISYLPLQTGCRVLDVGSGGGWVAKSLYRKSVSVISLDLSPPNLLAIHRETNQPAVAASGTFIPLRDASVDYVIASEVIEHMNDPAKALTEFFRVIRPGGRVVITTPYKEKIRYYLCIHCNKITPANAHLHSFDEHSLVKLISSAGATEIYYRRIGNKFFLRSHIYNLMRWVPLPVWSGFDRFANLLLPRVHQIIVCGIK